MNNYESSQGDTTDTIADMVSGIGERVERLENLLEGNVERASNAADFIRNYAENLEEEFLGAVERAGRIGDIEIHQLWGNLKGMRYGYEYDIVGRNDEYVVVGEIKHKFREEYVTKFVEQRLPYFADEFERELGDRKVIGMIGGAGIDKDAEAEAKRLGLIILKLENRKLVVENAEGAQAVEPATN